MHITRKFQFHHFSGNVSTFEIIKKNIKMCIFAGILMWWIFESFASLLNYFCFKINVYPAIHYNSYWKNVGYMNLLTFSFIIDESQRKTFYFLKEILLILVIKFFRFNWQRRDYWVLQKTRCCYWSKWSRQVIVQVSHQRLGNC